MELAEIIVLVGGLAFIAALAWYFFAPKAAEAAKVRGGVQEIDITVNGGYSPDLVRVTAGTPHLRPPGQLGVHRARRVPRPPSRPEPRGVREDDPRVHPEPGELPRASA